MQSKVHDYHDGNRTLQDLFDTRLLADKLAEKSRKAISQSDREFIESCDMFFIATCDNRGLPTCSYKGGDPGFVSVVDKETIAFPNYDGNGKYLSTGNAIINPGVGLLFIDFANQKRLRLQGEASIDTKDALLIKYPGAQFIVRVGISEIFGNCSRYIHKYTLVERSSYLPRADGAAPIPDWKHNPEIRKLLPKSDPAR